MLITHLKIKIKYNKINKCNKNLNKHNLYRPVIQKMQVIFKISLEIQKFWIKKIYLCLRKIK